MKQRQTTLPFNSSSKSEIFNSNKKKNLSSITKNNSNNNNSILTFFSISSVHKSDNIQASRQINTNKKEKNARLSKYNFLINPSKKKIKNLKGNDKPEIDIKKYNLFNEDDIYEIINIITSNIKEDFEKTFIELSKENYLPFNFNNNSYEKFLFNHFENIITKFILMNYSDLLYIPKSYFKEYENCQFKNIKLLSGFNGTKGISLQYNPINIEEIELFYPNLFKEINSYIKTFKKNRKKNKKQKACVLFKNDEDFLGLIKDIETIYNNLDYQIIRIDDESNKQIKLNKISEATKSQRISSIDEQLIQKINILEYMIGHSKWRNFLLNSGVIYESKIKIPLSDSFIFEKENPSQIKTQSTDINILEKLSFSQNNSKDSNSRTISILGKENNSTTSSINRNSQEYIVFENFKQNVFNICLKKKTLILISDFLNMNDENKEYLNQIIKKIPDSKCPIVILTNNLSLFNSKNGFYNQVNFEFYKIENEGYEHKDNIIYSITIFIFLHLYLLIPEQQPNDIKKIKDEIKRIFSEKRLKVVFLTQKLYEKIIKISILIGNLNKYNFEDILVYLSNAIRYVKDNARNEDIPYKLKILEEMVLKDIEKYKVNEIEDENFDNELNEDNLNLNNIEFICNETEKNSFFDYIDYNLKSLSKKNYQFLKTTYKLNEEFENGEYYQLIQYFNFKQPNENTFKDYNIIKKRINEDKDFYHNYLNNHLILTKKEIGQYNLLINKLYNLNEESLNEIFGIRKTRRTTRNSNKKENLKHEENEKISLINKLFSKASSEQIERFIESHKQNNLYIEFSNKEDEKDEKYKIINFDKCLGYYNNYKVYEQIKNEQNKFIENSIESDDEMDDIDDDEDELLFDEKYN